MRLMPLFAVGCLLGVAAPSRAVDYQKIDRSINVEPKYKSTPKYGLLVFGPEAKQRVWVVADGETLYLDRNGNGDLTDEGEKFTADPDGENETAGFHKIIMGNKLTIPSLDGKTKYTIKNFSVRDDKKLKVYNVMTFLTVAGASNYEQYADFNLSADKSSVPVAHFHGPLSIASEFVAGQAVPENAKLATGDKPAKVRAHVGTFDKSAGCWVVVTSHKGNDYNFGEGVHAEVSVEFPAKSPGGERVTKRYTLPQFC